MKNLLFTTIILISFLFTSCYKEDALVATSANSADRFLFPQGNNSYDNSANEIFKKFGVKIIYKDFRDVDFNLSWTNTAVGKVGYSVSQDQEKDAVEFIVDNFFKYLSPQITNKILLPYFYVADSIYQKSLISNATTTLESVVAYPYVYNGLDYWSFCWNGAGQWTKLNGSLISSSLPTTRPVTSYQKFYRRGVMLKEVFKKDVLNGIIKIPDGFATGFDFTTAIKYAAGTETDVNYYKRRGFPGQMTNVNNFDLTQLTLVTRTNPTQIFADYIHLCMRYQADSIEILYPKAKYPLIHEKYPIVIDFIKNQYKIDLSSIAAKP